MSYRVTARLTTVMLFVLLLSACHGRDELGVDAVLGDAADACSGLSQEADLVNCQARLYVARDDCSRLSDADKSTCNDMLDELSRAAIEGYHVARRECDLLTSEAARTICRGSAEAPAPTNEPLLSPPAASATAHGAELSGMNVAPAAAYTASVASAAEPTPEQTVEAPPTVWPTSAQPPAAAPARLEPTKVPDGGKKDAKGPEAGRKEKKPK